jgi:hypothetical protein
MALKIYKRGQGYYTRLYSALVAFAIVAAGCFALYRQLSTENLWIQAFVTAGVCAGFAALPPPTPFWRGFWWAPARTNPDANEMDEMNEVEVAVRVFGGGAMCR